MTNEQKLLDLFARLSRAAARSQLCALRAKEEGQPALARLFLALAESQTMQANRFFIQARGFIKSTAENETRTFTAELPELLTELQQLSEKAGSEENKALTTGFSQSAKVIQGIIGLHDTLADKAADTEYHVCDFCGYIQTGEPPESCPVCTAPRKRFKLIDFAA